jgi:hypothetical protein
MSWLSFAKRLRKAHARDNTPEGNSAYMTTRAAEINEELGAPIVVCVAVSGGKVYVGTAIDSNVDPYSVRKTLNSVGDAIARRVREPVETIAKIIRP